MGRGWPAGRERRFVANPPPFSAVKHFFTFGLAPTNLKLLLWTIFYLF